MFAEALRTILHEVLRKRKTSDPRYSLRAMARELAVAPSQLSLILSGRRGLSPARAERFGKALGFSEDVLEHFRLLATAAHARSYGERQQARRVLTRPAREQVKRCRRGTYLSLASFECRQVLEEIRAYVEGAASTEGEGTDCVVEVVLYPADYCR